MKLLPIAFASLLITATAAFALPDPTPMYRALHQQGYTNIEMYQVRNRIHVYAHEGDQVRQLVYDAQTGQLLWDSLNPLRDRTRDRLYLLDQDQLRTQDRIRLQDPDQLKLQDQDRTRDPSTH
ncbi:MAG: hypothetical protein KGI94_00900 [Paracoccaceae bacterium]|nr:hypothetical protein [Paracoccaceae bacterium]